MKIVNIVYTNKGLPSPNIYHKHNIKYPFQQLIYISKQYFYKAVLLSTVTSEFSYIDSSKIRKNCRIKIKILNNSARTVNV